MSQENVEVVRAALEAVNRKDWDAVFKDTTLDFEFDMSRGVGPASGVHRRDQAKKLGSDFYELWASFRIEPHEFMEAGDDVVVPWLFSATGRDGIEVKADVSWTFTLRAGKIARMVYFPTQQEALEAVGLRAGRS
jgi:ketosteroid isomerase-like protein